MGRIWRPGQSQAVTIYRLIIASSFEEKILERQQLKNDLSEKLLDNGNQDRTYDILSLKNLFIKSSEECLIYPQSANKLAELKDNEPGLSWEGAVYICLKVSHQEKNRKFINEFELADFEDNLGGDGAQNDDEHFSSEESEEEQS